MTVASLARRPFEPHVVQRAQRGIRLQRVVVGKIGDRRRRAAFERQRRRNLVDHLHVLELRRQRRALGASAPRAAPYVRAPYVQHRHLGVVAHVTERSCTHQFERPPIRHAQVPALHPPPVLSAWKVFRMRARTDRAAAKAGARDRRTPRRCRVRPASATSSSILSRVSCAWRMYENALMPRRPIQGMNSRS